MRKAYREAFELMVSSPKPQKHRSKKLVFASAGNWLKLIGKEGNWLDTLGAEARRTENDADKHEMKHEMNPAYRESF